MNAETWLAAVIVAAFAAGSGLWAVIAATGPGGRSDHRH